MLTVKIQDNKLVFGKGFEIVLERTLRIPDDGKNYPLPPGLGAFPIHKVDDFRDKVPRGWLDEAGEGYFIPMYQREAMWIRFNGRQWRPNAVKIGIGMVNAVSGKQWDRILNADKEDYIVAPPQPWLDGINVGEGVIRQFVAMPLGQGYTVEAQLTGKEDVGGVQLVVYEPKSGLFPEKQPEEYGILDDVNVSGINLVQSMTGAAPATGSMLAMDMGIGAGGTMKQKIYEDPHGLETWDEDNASRVFIHIVNSESYKAITGLEPPETPISAEAYTKYGFPWIDIYDEHMQTVSPSDELGGVKSIKELDKEQGLEVDPAEVELEIDDSQIIKQSLDSLPDRNEDMKIDGFESDSEPW